MHQSGLNRYLVLPPLPSFIHEDAFPLNRQFINVQRKRNCRVSQKYRQLRDHKGRDGAQPPLISKCPMDVGIPCYPKIC